MESVDLETWKLTRECDRVVEQALENVASGKFPGAYECLQQRQNRRSEVGDRQTTAVYNH